MLKIVVKARSTGMTTTTKALLSYFTELNSNRPYDIDSAMLLQLDKIHPKFRELVDLLFFSDRMDLDLSKFRDLLRESYNIHFEYLWDRFSRCLPVFWEDSVGFWSHRLNFLLSLGDRNLSKRIEHCLEKRMFEAVRLKYELDVKYDVEYLQFIEFCKIKHARKESLVSVKNYLTEMPAHMRADKLISIVNSFVPIVFKTIDEYVEIMSKKITTSHRNYELLVALEAKGVPFDKKPMIALARELVFDRDRKAKNCRAFFTILNDTEVRAAMKKEYNSTYHEKLLTLVRASDFTLLEDQHLRNLKNLIDLYPLFADEVANIYADKLYSRGLSHKRAHADRLIRLLKAIPQISQRKVLVYLSTNNKMVDIKYILNAFPDLKKLAAFV